VDAQWQRRVVHFYRNVFSVVPSAHMRGAAGMLKAIACEDRQAALAEAEAVIEKLSTISNGTSLQR